MRVRGAAVALLLLSGVVVGGVAGAVPAGGGTANPTPTPAPTPNPCVGTMRAPANGTTVVSIQGWPHGGRNTNPRLVGVGPEGTVRWVYRPRGAVWSYDVDPVGDGRLFGIATVREGGEPRTRFYLLDVPSRTVVWTETVDVVDTHDADLLGPHRILVANMRAFENGTSRDRIAVYNRTSGEFVWSWYFRDHYPSSTDDGIGADDDWTHVNDVDRIAPGRYLASPRNFDQVIVVDRTTGRIDLRLGRDERERVLNFQHNPTYLRGEGGRPTILVADSENDRAVEYARTTFGWDRTWQLRSPQWVRDADRLPSGNTLVTASEGNRVMEVAPDGSVVWEFAAPWLPYDAERIAHGDEPGGPTIAEQDAGGTVLLSGDADPSADRLEACARYLRSVDSEWTRAEAGTPTPPETRPPTATTAADDATGTPATTAEPGSNETPDSGTTAPPEPGETAGSPRTVAVAVLSLLVVVASALLGLRVR